MIGLKSETHFAQGNKTPHQKPGRDHQRERKRNLQDDDCVAEFSVTETAAEALAGVAQGLVQIFSGGLERGDEAKSQGRQHGHAQSEDQHRSVQANDRLCGNNVLRHQCNDEFQTSPSQQCSQDGTAQRQY